MGNKKDKIKASGLYPEQHIGKAEDDLNVLIEALKKKQNKEKETLKKEIKAMGLSQDDYSKILQSLELK